MQQTGRRVPRGASSPGPGEYNHYSTKTLRYSSFGSSQRKPQYLDRQYPGPGMPIYPPTDGNFPQYTGPVSSLGNAATRPSSAAFSFGASDRGSSSRNLGGSSRSSQQVTIGSRPQTSDVRTSIDYLLTTWLIPRYASQSPHLMSCGLERLLLMMLGIKLSSICGLVEMSLPLSCVFAHACVRV